MLEIMLGVATRAGVAMGDNRGCVLQYQGQYRLGFTISGSAGVGFCNFRVGRGWILQVHGWQMSWQRVANGVGLAWKVVGRLFLLWLRVGCSWYATAEC